MPGADLAALRGLTLAILGLAVPGLAVLGEAVLREGGAGAHGDGHGQKSSSEDAHAIPPFVEVLLSVARHQPLVEPASECAGLCPFL